MIDRTGQCCAPEADRIVLSSCTGQEAAGARLRREHGALAKNFLFSFSYGKSAITEIPSGGCAHCSLSIGSLDVAASEWGATRFTAHGAVC